MSTENVPASHFNPLGSETQSVNTSIYSGGSSHQNESHLGETSGPCQEIPGGPTNHTIRPIYFLDLLSFNCNHKK